MLKLAALINLTNHESYAFGGLIFNDTDGVMRDMLPYAERYTKQNDDHETDPDTIVSDTYDTLTDALRDHNANAFGNTCGIVFYYADNDTIYAAFLIP